MTDQGAPTVKSYELETEKDNLIQSMVADATSKVRLFGLVLKNLVTYFNLA